MIKIAHTIFALPFAIIGWAWGVAAVKESAAINPELNEVAVRSLPVLAERVGAGPWAWTLIWVVIAMVGARSFAMAFNRIVDRKIDASNPRTAKRELVTGTLSLRFAWGVALFAALLFLTASAMINHQTLILAPLALVIIGGYSLTKRWTALCHLVLGLGLALAPLGGWLAAVGRPWDIASGNEWAPLGLTIFTSLEGAGNAVGESLAIVLQPSVVALALGVLLWVAGFDVIYSLQDEDFDRGYGLKSIPVRMSAKGALFISRLLHAGAMVCWILAIVFFDQTVRALSQGNGAGALVEYAPEHTLGAVSYLALVIAGVCLLYEHSLVKHDDLGRVDAAFFTMNGVISIVFALLVILDVFVIG